MSEIGRKLLVWYDVHARELPWRVPPNQPHQPNPYAVWLSEIMLQQTNVTTVKPYFAAFMARWPDIGALAAAKDEDVLAAWAGLGYYARARNLLKCARVVDRLGGFPDSEAGLLDLPGIGPYTAAAVASIAFGRVATVMDGNIERVMARLYAVQTPLPTAKPELKKLAAALTPDQRAGDHAQALMDLGATICIAKTPRCGRCPLSAFCAAYQAGGAEALPRRLAKKPRPTRQGMVYFARQANGHVLLETRAEKGLLGGMLGLVGSEWSEAPAEFAPPFAANWQKQPTEIRHVFTHFNLILTVFAAEIEMAVPKAGRFMPPPAPEDMPSVMRKAYLAGIAALGGL